MDIHQNEANVTHRDRFSERRLWCAVLLQALEDWKSPNLRLKKRAENFFFRGGADFARVCTGAGLVPECVLSRLQQLRESVGRWTNGECHTFRTRPHLP